MGITSNYARFLFFARNQGADFTRTIMLGRQQLFMSNSEIQDLARRSGTELNDLPSEGGYSEPFFTKLGAEKIDSIDYSDFEKASIIHDLNSPVSVALNGKYTVVFDGGTLEHVFNFPVAIKNCMDMLEVGGHFIGITPTNNYCGHGFYQFSPELFFSLFDATCGFKIKVMVIGCEIPDHNVHWYQVKNPHLVKTRVTLSNSYPTTLMIIAQKVDETVSKKIQPAQSDYKHIWNVHESIVKNVKLEEERNWMHYYRRFTPESMKKIIRKLRNKRLNDEADIEGLGKANPLFFTPIEF